MALTVSIGERRRGEEGKKEFHVKISMANLNEMTGFIHFMLDISALRRLAWSISYGNSSNLLATHRACRLPEVTMATISEIEAIWLLLGITLN